MVKSAVTSASNDQHGIINRVTKATAPQFQICHEMVTYAPHYKTNYKSLTINENMIDSGSFKSDPRFTTVSSHFILNLYQRLTDKISVSMQQLRIQY